MSDFLQRMSVRAQGLEPALKPRTPSRFEPLADGGGMADIGDGLTVEHEREVGDARPAPSVPPRAMSFEPLSDARSSPLHEVNQASQASTGRGGAMRPLPRAVPTTGDVGSFAPPPGPATGAGTRHAAPPVQRRAEPSRSKVAAGDVSAGSASATPDRSPALVAGPVGAAHASSDLRQSALPAAGAAQIDARRIAVSPERGEPRPTHIPSAGVPPASIESERVTSVGEPSPPAGDAMPLKTRREPAPVPPSDSARRPALPATRLATIPSAPAATAGDAVPAESVAPVVEVHIRSIEIHAIPPPAAAPRPTGPSLDAFLARRGSR